MLSVPALADIQIDMANGDRLSGHVVTEDEKYLVISNDYGMMKLPKALMTARSDSSIAQELAVIEPAVGQVVERDEDGKIIVLGANWSGGINLGGALESGNADKKTVEADGDIEGRWSRHRYGLAADFLWEQDEGEISEREFTLANRYDYFYSEKWFLNATARFEQNEPEKLQLRQVYGAGLGYQAFDRDDLKLKVSFGPSYLKEEFTDETQDDSSAWNWDLAYEQDFWDGAFGTFHEHQVLVSSDNKDDFLLESESGITLPIRGGIVLSGVVEFDWDNEPVDGEREEDTTYSLKVGYEFGD